MNTLKRFIAGFLVFVLTFTSLMMPTYGVSATENRGFENVNLTLIFDEENPGQGDNDDETLLLESYISIEILTEFPSGTVNSSFVDIEYIATPTEGATVAEVFYSINGRYHDHLYWYGNNTLGQARVFIIPGYNQLEFTVIDSLGFEATYAVDNTPFFDEGRLIAPHIRIEDGVPSLIHADAYFIPNRLTLYTMAFHHDVCHYEVVTAVASIGGTLLGYNLSFNSIYDIEVPENDEAGLIALGENIIDDFPHLFEYFSIQYFGICGVGAGCGLHGCRDCINALYNANGGGSPREPFRAASFITEFTTLSANESICSWGLDAINMPEAWIYNENQKNHERQNIRIGVIDTAVMYNHPDFYRYDENGNLFQIPVSNISDIRTPSHSHGTETMGVIAGNRTGAINVAFDNLYAYDVGGRFRGLAQALNWNVVRGTRVINISGAPFLEDALEVVAFQAEMQRLLDVGYEFIVITSAGHGSRSANESLHAILTQGASEALLSRIITVGASMQDGNLWPFSNFGSRVSIVAPGHEIYTATTGYPDIRSADGSSVATPFVTSAASLIWDQFPGLCGTDIVRIIIESAVGGQRIQRGNCNCIGNNDCDNCYWLLNALAAIQQAEAENPNLIRRSYILVGQVLRHGTSTDVPISGANVRLYMNNRPLSNRHIDSTDNFGHYRLPGFISIPTINFHLEITADGFYPRIIPLNHEDLQLGVNTHRHFLAPMQLATLTGQVFSVLPNGVRESLPGAKIELWDRTSITSGRIGTTDAQGRFTIDNLTPNQDFYIVVSEASHRSVNRTVSGIEPGGQRNVDFTLSRTGLDREAFKPRWDITIATNILKLNDTLGLARVTVSPLAINPNGRIETVPFRDGVHFDHMGNGMRIRTSWVAPNTALLVRPNANGQVTSGRELFGDSTIMRNGQTAANGFEALRDLVGEDIFDRSNPYWDELYLWFDTNTNGVVDPGELVPLSETDIASFDLNYENSDFIDRHGNFYKQISTATMLDGTVAEFIDIWFIRNIPLPTPASAPMAMAAAMDMMATDIVAMNNAYEDEGLLQRVEALPQIGAFGTAFDLHTTMMTDTQLLALVEQFVTEEDSATRRRLVPQIIYRWTGASTNLAALEALTGEIYDGGTGPNAMGVINRGFDTFANTVYNVLMAQSHYWYLYEQAILTGDDDLLDMSLVTDEILRAIAANRVSGEILLLNIIENMQSLLILNDVIPETFQDIISASDERSAALIQAMDRRIIHQTNGHIIGTAMGEVFLIETGGNAIDGRQGDNIYYFGPDSGANTVQDTSGDNIILLPSQKEDFTVYFNARSTIVLTAGNGTITLTGFNANVSYTIIFLDGSTYDLTDLIGFEEIYTADDLVRVNNSSMFGFYRLMADIDLSGTDWTPIGTAAAPFTGILDGNGFEINGLTVNHPSTDNNGLFGVNHGRIRNVTLKNVNITGRNNTGGLAGQSNGTITGSTVSGTINGGQRTGGLIGGSTGGRIQGSGSTANVTGTTQAGGLAGYIFSGVVEMSWATGNVSATSSVGGLVGYSTISLISQSYAAGNVIAANGTNAGGLVGDLNTNDTVKNCFATGTVIGTSRSSGLAGHVNGAGVRIENSYTISSHVNGIINIVSRIPTIISSYHNSDLVPPSTPNAERGRTTAQMAQVETYQGWDFETVWIMSETGYPMLRGLPESNGAFFVGISTADELSAIRNNPSGSYRLAADIDLSGTDWIPIGTIAAPFIGIFDGNGFEINGLAVNLPGIDNNGLFGVNHGMIRDVTLTDVNITGRNNTGGLAGQSNGTITGSTVSGTVTGGQRTGGLIGSSTGGRIHRSGSTANVTGTTQAGGLAGYIYSGAVEMSWAAGNVSATSSVGGLVGYSTISLISQSYAAGNVIATNGTNAGGLVGDLNSNDTVQNCFATGTVIGTNRSSGLAGNVNGNGAKIENSYTISPHVNGIINIISRIPTIISSYHNSDLVTLSAPNAERGRTTAQFAQVETYQGWDFETVWIMSETGYPMLRGLPDSNGAFFVGISTADELSAIRNNPSGSYRLTADIDLSGTDWIPIGTTAAPFIGIFDGNGFEINGLTVNLPGIDNNGLFGVNHGMIKDVTLTNVNITGRNNTGGLAGQSNGTITGSTVSGTINGGQRTGGLIGGSTGGRIQRSSSTANVTGTTQAGGLTGYIFSGVVEMSWATGNVSAASSVGGLVGFSTQSQISQSYAEGNVVATNGTEAGGLVGTLNENDTIQNCFATGTVVGTSRSSGLIGHVNGNGARIENSYTISSHVNGIFNIWSRIPTIISSYHNSDLIPLSAPNAERGRTTSQMAQVETYQGWDFETIWVMGEAGYPMLRGLPMPNGVYAIFTIIDESDEPEIDEQDDDEANEVPEDIDEPDEKPEDDSELDNDVQDDTEDLLLWPNSGYDDDMNQQEWQEYEFAEVPEAA